MVRSFAPPPASHIATDCDANTSVVSANSTVKSVKSPSELRSGNGISIARPTSFVVTGMANPGSGNVSSTSKNNPGGSTRVLRKLQVLTMREGTSVFNSRTKATVPSEGYVTHLSFFEKSTDLMKQRTSLFFW